MAFNKLTQCPLCNMNLEPNAEARLRDYGECAEIDCEHCGTFTITATAAATIDNFLANSDRDRMALRRAILLMQQPGQKPEIDSRNMERFANEMLPTPAQQAENLILHIGQSLAGDPGGLAWVGGDKVAALIGSIGFHSSSISA